MRDIVILEAERIGSARGAATATVLAATASMRRSAAYARPTRCARLVHSHARRRRSDPQARREGHSMDCDIV